ncbi:helix-turn-helix transcriptional regulator [Alistipes sp. OttesenSCG-928-B03]|nr:helix-turn-helix transcriptional regulator [Alistipes sp. OttesenSCG-928-B03]
MEEKKIIYFTPGADCPVRHVLSRIGDKWSVLVMATLNANGTMRFGQIHKAIGDISQRMLTVTLRSLEADGLVSREVYAEVPPRTEYELTPLAESLMPHVEALVNWSSHNLARIMESRQRFE